MSYPWNVDSFFYPQRLDHIAALYRLSPFDARWVTTVCTGHANLELVREDLSWTLGGVPNPHLDKLMVVLTHAVTKIGRQLAEGGSLTDAQIEVYVGGALYCLWIEFAPRFQALIDTDTVEVRWFDAWLARYRALFGYKGITLPDPGHLLALFYQARRVWHFAATLLPGRSPSTQAARLAVSRANIAANVCLYADSLYDKMPRVPVLITGEPGTGKELAARCVASSRYIAYDPRARRFVQKHSDGYHIRNLAEVPRDLLASTLFGYKKGAFTGALDDTEGLFALLKAGTTLCLDEMGEIPEWVQVMLLRPLQTYAYVRVGDHVERPIEGRIICSTNADLEAKVRAGTFRADLLERLKLVQIHMPTLRQRFEECPDDLVDCVRVFVKQFLGITAPVESWTARVIECLRKDWETFSWGGNLRALRNYTVRVIIEHGGETKPQIEPPPPSPERRSDTEPPPNTRAITSVAMPSSGMIGPEAKKGKVRVGRVIRSYVKHVYKLTGYNLAETARRVGLDTRTVRKLLGLTPKRQPTSKRRLKPKSKPKPE